MAAIFKLEYAQRLNGEFQAWIEAGLFAERAKAEAAARGRGLEAGDYLITQTDLRWQPWREERARP